MALTLDWPLVFPEGFARLRADLARSATDWNYLSAITGDGPVRDLEKALGRHFGSRWVVALTSGSMALHVALLASGVGPGDEVILPAVTWPQVIFAIRHCGATPVMADIAPRAVTVDPASVAKRLSAKTRAILATHLYGFPADLERLRSMAQSAGASLISDAAQGVGTLIRGKPVGTMGDFVALSFGRGKLLNAGEGGALICRRRELYERAIRVSQHPLRMHRDIDDPALRDGINPLGLNGRLHPLVASLALGQLQGLSRRRSLQVIRARFGQLVQDAQNAGLGGLLPSLPSWGNPSGVCLPLLDDIGERAGLLREVAGRSGYQLCEEAPPRLLSAMEPRSPLPFRGGTCGPKAKRIQHKALPCPNAEELSRNLRWSMRFDARELLKESLASG